MIRARVVGVSVFAVMLAASATHGQAGAHYRDFQLGGDIASVAALTGVGASDVTTASSLGEEQRNSQWSGVLTA